MKKIFYLGLSLASLSVPFATVVACNQKNDKFVEAESVGNLQKTIKTKVVTFFKEKNLSISDNLLNDLVLANAKYLHYLESQTEKQLNFIKQYTIENIERKDFKPEKDPKYKKFWEMFGLSEGPWKAILNSGSISEGELISGDYDEKGLSKSTSKAYVRDFILWSIKAI